MQNEFNITGDYSKAIEDNSTDIMICLISLLNDAKITLFDNKIGKLFIALVNDPEIIKKNMLNDIPIGLFVSIEPIKDSYIYIAFEIIQTKAKAIDYIENFNFDESKRYELTEVVTSRKNGKLILEKIH